MVLLLTSACSNDGRPAFITDRGVSKKVVKANGVAPKGDGLLYQFQLAAEEAKPRLDNKVLTLPPAEKQRIFMRAGFALILARCNEYILSKSDNQRTVNVVHDAFAPVTALATGAIALFSKGDDVNNDWLTALSLGTTGMTAGFKIYEQRFLFGAENVNSVRRLVIAALNDNAAEANKSPAEPDNKQEDKLTYSQAVIHLIVNQSICSPGHILELVSDAIQKSNVKSVPDGQDKPGSASSPDAKSAEQKKIAELEAVIAQLKKDGSVTDKAIKTATETVAKNPPPSPPPAQAQDVPPPAATGGLSVITTTVSNR